MARLSGDQLGCIVDRFINESLNTHEKVGGDLVIGIVYDENREK